MSKFLTILSGGQCTNDNLREVNELGFRSWDEALQVYEQIQEFSPAPPYGFTAEAAENLQKWPDSARFAYQVVLETPVGDLPLTFVQFTEHLLQCKLVNKYNCRAAYTLGYEDTVYQT